MSLKYSKNCILVSWLLVLHVGLYAQVKPIVKLSKIAVGDFKVNSPVVDENANAVILYDIGSSEFEGNNNGDFTLVFKQTKRILLKSRNAFDLATVKIPIYIGSTSAGEERLVDVEATTYNLENGQIRETKLDKNSIFKEKYNRYYLTQKFSFPDIKEGSIIEYKYTVKSPYYSQLRAWRFQEEYPVLWSQYQVTIPPMFNYLRNMQGYLKFAVDSVNRIYKSYSIVDPGNASSSSSVYSFSGDALNALWIMKEAPAFKNEGFTSNSANYVSKISFNLHSIKYSDNNTQRIVKDWYTKAGEMLKDEDYVSITDDHSWMDEDVKQLTAGKASLEKAKAIYNFVRDHFTCNDNTALWLSQPLKKTYQSKTGNVADINFMLMSMLFHAGIESKAVVLSTKDNGKPNETTAILSEYNYVIASTTIDSVHYLLDASYSKLGFGKLKTSCFNGAGRMIDDKKPILVPLVGDSLIESKSTLVFIVNTPGKGLEGTFTSNLGYYESLKMREELAKEKLETYQKSIAKSFPAEVEIADINIDSLSLYENPVSLQYNMKLKLNGEDIIYFNPLFNEGMKKNPFTLAERQYPVEMPYVPNEIYTLNMEVPEGYKVDELPKSARINLNEDEGMFEYIIRNNNNSIQLRCRLVLKKATYTAEDYSVLRDFYAFIVKKEAEQIVFKKIN